MRIRWSRCSDVTRCRKACELIFYLLGNQIATWPKSRKPCFKWSNGPKNSFSAFWMSQNATWVKSRKRCFKWSKSPRTHFLLSAHPKIPLGWSQESDFSRGWNTLRNHFLLSGRPYMRLGRGRESDVSWGACLREIIFWFLVVGKSTCSSFDKAMFQGV
jgi:hypothetical protein